ncbi:ATP-dependent Clp protease proteolytic subunit [Pseudidiomarina halophila]|uniref:Clp protease n=1 Tax=Pseudidiomarina halophila TaxID=1449799 RepID=A0A432XYV1_9GAMM|nr:ATP-dependent Clp protease proteolytic subunit [Pseudidiomarina halophila]RUO53928.1 hypothetical protein CWI69_00360 [Pseudidiomarina halophila]
MEKKGNYLLRHWRGELPLAVSFWVNVVLLNVVSVFLVNVFWLGGSFDGMHWQTSQNILTGSIVVGLSVGVWQIVGTWSSATRYRANGGSGFLAGLVKVLMALGTLSLVSNTILTMEELNLRNESAREQAFVVKVSDNKEIMTIDGEIGVTISDEVIRTLEQHPNLKTVLLNSVGGDLDEAFRIVDALETYQATHRPISTYVHEHCASACTIIYMSGAKRLLNVDATLGFHQFRMYVPSSSEYQNIARLNRKVSDYFAQKGLLTSFRRVMFQADADNMWYPDSDLLLSTNVVHEVISQESVAKRNAMIAANAKTPDYLSIIKNKAPTEYDELVRLLDEIPQDENYFSNVEVTTRHYVSQLRVEAMLRIDDLLLMKTLLREVRMYAAMNRSDPELCIKSLYPTDYGFPNYDSVIRYQDEDELVAEVTEIFEQAFQSDDVSVNADLGQSDLDLILADMGAHADALISIEPTLEGYRAHCQAVTDFYERIYETLPVKRAANLTRYLLTEDE